MTVFEAVKENISCNDAAERLGLKGKRTYGGKGVWCCPFHDDHTPSMTCFDRDNRFYCFSCHASGDAANLYAKVRGLSPKAAAQAALSEFGIAIPGVCDRPRNGPDQACKTQNSLSPRLVTAEKMVRKAWQEAKALIAEGMANGMIHVMQQSPDKEGWLWSYALQQACLVQDECNRLRAMDDEDVQSEITEKLAAWRGDHGPEWPDPGVKTFLAILDDLERTQADFPRLSKEERKAVLDKLCWVPREAIEKGA